MIEKIEISGNDYKIEEPLRKYTEKKIGRLDRYLPRGTKKDVVAKVVISEIGKSKGDKYEISAAMDIIDLVEAKLMGQIRRYKLEMQPHRQKRSLKNIFRKKR